MEVEGRQLDSLSSQSNRDISLQFIMPFSDANAVDVEIKRRITEDGEKMHWVVNLHTESPELGEVWLNRNY